MAEMKKPILEESNDILVRIGGQDIPGSKSVYAGLTRIKGVSWSISNLVCRELDIDKKKKISEINKETIKEIEKHLEVGNIPNYLKNRQGDLESGKALHLLGVNLDIRKDMDIKRLRQIKSYRGLRHALKLPVRGQRTRSHFRKTGIVVGVKKSKVGKKG